MNATHEAATLQHLGDGQCADLVLGLVPGEARELWLNHAAGCPECEARLKSHLGAVERGRAEWRARTPRGSVLPRAIPYRGTPLVALAAAAVLAVAIALPLLDRSPASSVSNPWLTGLGESVRTRGGDVEDPHLTLGMQAYAAHDLRSADRELTKARATGASESMRRLYLAHVRLSLGRSLESVELLSSLNWRSIPEPYRREGVELLARALRAGGKIAAADSIESTLRAIPPGTPFLP